MKIGFYHDFPVKYVKERDEFYSTGFSYEIWERYLLIFDAINIISRINYHKNLQDVKNLSKHSLSSGENVSFTPLNSYKNINSLFKLQNIVKEVNQSIDNNDGYILRLPSVIGFITGLILIWRKRPYIVENVGSAKEAFYYKGGAISKFFALPMEYLQKVITKKASIVIYITNDFLQSRYPTKGVGYSSMANVSFNFPEKSHSEIKDCIEYIKNKNIEKIGLVGSLDVNYKGHKLAIDALSILHEHGYRNLKLEFVGGGSKQSIKKWKKRAEKKGVLKHIAFLGVKKPGEDIYNWMRSIDIYIQPSLTEGHGRSLVEAVRNGCICLGSNVGGIPDTINNKYLFDKKNVFQLVKLIENIINNKKFRYNNIIENYKKIKKYDEDLISSKRATALETYKLIIK